MVKQTNYGPAKLPLDVLESARNVSSLSGVQMMDLMGDILRPALLERERELLAKRARELAAAEGVEEPAEEPSPAPKRRGRPRKPVADGGVGG